MNALAIDSGNDDDRAGVRPTAMESNTIYNTKLQLISPPPEETLRRMPKHSLSSPMSATKRKYSQLAVRFSTEPFTENDNNIVQPLTPNSKPRKRVLVVQSPHENNPNADYIPPAPLNALSPERRRSVLGARSRRSATPIPPYEPPTDIFTPPKEVFVTPTTTTIRVSKSSKRKSTKPKKRKTTPTAIVVKHEMPEIDLNAPMPPPSPSDDPLLLSSSVEPKSTSPLLPISKLHFNNLPPSSPPDNNITPQMPLFELTDAGRDVGWSDDEDDELPVASALDQYGETDCTGDWEEVLVRTKTDPPSSATRCRIEEWGNPKSPFPLQRHLHAQDRWGFLSNASGAGKGNGEENNEEKEEEQEEKEKEDTEREEEEEVQRMSIEPVGPIDTFDLAGDVGCSRGGSCQSENWLDMSGIVDAFEHMGNQHEVEHVQGQILSSQPLGSDVDLNHGEVTEICSVAGDSMQPNEENSTEMSHVEEAFSRMGNPLEDMIMQDTDQEFEFDIHPEEDIVDAQSSFSEPDEPDIVKITSMDPRAAARAAAILKQHNYDCFTKIELRRRHSTISRRRSAGPQDFSRENLKYVSPTGIRKDKRKLSPGMGVVEDMVIVHGTPLTTLPELLKEAETEVYSPTFSPFISKYARILETPLPTKLRSSTPRLPMSPGEMCYDPLTGERMWTKEEWKRLDACFTDERLEAAQRFGISLGAVTEDGLASVDLVDIENVVKRFVDWMGGVEAVGSFGPAWTTENLMQRARVLQKKQRAGNIASPTTPWSPSLMPSPISSCTATLVDPSVSGSRALGTRVKSLLFSYLPLSKKTGVAAKGIGKPGLPLPSEEVFTRQKALIITPVREPLPKPIAPKALVQLHQAPPLASPNSKIPRIIPPKELVELHPPPPKEMPNKEALRPRNSGASVKDLIKDFEERDFKGTKREGCEQGLQRMRSIGEWRTKIGNVLLHTKPVWKP